MTFYVDLSHHDWDRAKGEIDFAAVKAATSPVICIRATYGDPTGFHPQTRAFAEMQAGAAAAGFTCRGGYHNLVSGDTASMRRQVSWFRSELDKANCQWAMVDIERYDELVNNGLWPRFSDVLRFRDAWAAQDDRPLTYYLPRWLWHDFYNSPDLRQLGGPLVASNYGANTIARPSTLYSTRGGDTGVGWTAYGNVTPSVWQFGSQCSVPGLGGATDINAYRGTVDQLSAMVTGGDMLTAADIKQLVEAFWSAEWGTGDNRESAATRLAKASAAASILPTLIPKLEEILAAAEDDTNTTVTLPADALATLKADLQSIKDAVANVPAATIAEIAS